MAKQMTYFLIGIFFVSVLHGLTACASEQKVDQTQSLAADSSALIYAGRIDASDSKSPALIWQGSSVTLNYRGQVDTVEFADVEGSAFFDVIINGKRTGMIKAQNGKVDLPKDQTVAADQNQTLNLIKRSEAAAGHASIKNIILNGSPLATEQKPSSPEFLFFGDSITAGACSEDGAEDQWDDFSTHNSLSSYAALTAKHFGATYQNISVSGIGISTGYQTTITAPDIWNALYPKANSAKANLNYDSPKIIFLNYGENDDSYSKKQGQEFPADFTERYLNLLKDIRQQFPHSAIVILRGGMSGGANSERLRKPLDEVIKQFTQEDSNAYHFAFNHWSALHPRTKDHQLMATELSDWLKKNKIAKRQN